MTTRPYYLPQVAEAQRTGRWTIRRKGALLNAIDSREISEADALATFRVTSEELHSWRKLNRIGGWQAMRATRLQDYR